MVLDGAGGPGDRPLMAGHDPSAPAHTPRGGGDLTLNTAAWYGDERLELPLPTHWETTVFRPELGSEITVDELRSAVSRPVGQRRISTLARGASRPVIVVDDPTRPTPAARVMPLLLDELAEAGIAAEAIQIVIATGTHGRPTAGTAVAKIGAETASRCRVHVHDHRRDSVRMGSTSFGTPVFVDRVVAGSDFVIGVGGVYPQHTTWFGGGAKLMLGVLGERSIASLHYRHWRQTTRYALDTDFRQDLNEVADIVGLRTSVLLHVDDQRQIVRATVGEPRAAFADAALVARDAFEAPGPGDADVVIANAYPMDTSLTFASSKGTVPLRFARPAASRVLIAACAEGGGRHGLFPLVNVPPLHYRVQWLRRQLVQREELGDKVWFRVKSGLRRSARSEPSSAPHEDVRPIHLVRPGREGSSLGVTIAGIIDSPSWDAAVATVDAEQNGRRPLRVRVYACAPLQTLAFENDWAETYEGGE